MDEKNYNFEYLINISKKDNNSYELLKIINSIDEKISDSKYNIIYHILPIMVYISLISGLIVMFRL